jgi:hypothetical protein
MGASTLLHPISLHYLAGLALPFFAEFIIYSLRFLTEVEKNN